MEWRPFNLHPEYPPEGIPRQRLVRRHGDGFGEQVRAMVEDAGLLYRPHPDVVPSSQAALRVGEAARRGGAFEAYHEAVFRAYWQEGRDIGDRSVLLEVAEGAGLARDAAVAALDGDEERSAVEASTLEAFELGIGGVPAWVVDGRVLISGAQPHALFERVLARLGHHGRSQETHSRP